MKEKSDYLLKNVCFLLFGWQNAIVFCNDDADFCK